MLRRMRPVHDLFKLYVLTRDSIEVSMGVKEIMIETLAEKYWDIFRFGIAIYNEDSLHASEIREQFYCQMIELTQEDES